MDKKLVLITGGAGDIAKSIISEIKKNFENYEILTPTSKEMNVADPLSVKEYLKKYKVDILVNNAGYILLDKIANNDFIEHKKVIDVNFTGVFLCTGEVLNKNPRAQIINIGSSAATKSHADWSSYCATKSAVLMATKCWADEGVNTICISPGRTISKMRKSMFPNEDQNTLMNPDDFAKIVIKAINNEYEVGINLDVNINNVKELINAEKNNYN